MVSDVHVVGVEVVSGEEVIGVDVVSWMRVCELESGVGVVYGVREVSAAGVGVIAMVPGVGVGSGVGVIID